MTKYIKGKDGKFAGSIGDGAVKTPPHPPLKVPRGVKISPEPQPVGRSDLLDMYDRFQDISREREDTAREGIKQLILRDYPTATELVVEEEDMSDALNGIPTPMVPVQVLDGEGRVLWEQNTVHRENTEFESKISELAQAVSRYRWDYIDTEEGFGRRYSLPV